MEPSGLLHGHACLGCKKLLARPRQRCQCKAWGSCSALPALGFSSHTDTQEIHQPPLLRGTPLDPLAVSAEQLGRAWMADACSCRAQVSALARIARMRSRVASSPTHAACEAPLVSDASAKPQLRAEREPKMLPSTARDGRDVNAHVSPSRMPREGVRMRVAAAP